MVVQMLLCSLRLTHSILESTDTGSRSGILIYDKEGLHFVDSSTRFLLLACLTDNREALLHLTLDFLLY